MSRFHTPPRRALALGMTAAVVGALLVAVLVGGCGGSQTSGSQAATRSRPLETIFEAEPQLLANPAATLDLLRRLGVDDVKVFLPWNELVPDPLSHTRPQFDAASPGAYPAASWAAYDTIVREAAARGVGVDLALEAPAPLWATGPGVPPGTTGNYLGAWKPSPQEFGLFASAVGTRYSGHYTPPGAASPLPAVHLWSIWNEPNYGTQLAPQAIDVSTVEVSPALYRSLVDAAWSALGRTGHGHDRVLIGEVAPRGHTIGDQPGNFSGMVPLRFIRALYCVDGSLRPFQGTAATERGCPTDSSTFARDHPGLFQAAGFAFHPYPQAFAPNVPTAPDGLGTDYADLPQLHKLEATLDGAAAAYGSDSHIALYDTEFGYQTDPPETIARAITPARAAGYANQAEYMSWRDPRVASWDQYLLADPAAGPSSFDTGLEFSDGRPKALYDAFRMPIWLPVTAAASGHSLEVWGCVRPVHSLAASSASPQIARIQFRPKGQSKFQTVKRVTLPDASGYFDAFVALPSSGVVRIAWTYPHGSTIHSRIVPITVQ